jgi:hypothetical protein
LFPLCCLCFVITLYWNASYFEPCFVLYSLHFTFYFSHFLFSSLQFVLCKK